MRRLGFVATFAVFLWCSAAYAQTTGTIFGDITDAVTGKKIEGAVVVVKSPALQGEQVAATDSTGRYRITLLPPGTYAIHVEATGYKAFDQGKIALEISKSIKVNIAMAPVAVTAKRVVVTAKATATVDQGSTTFGIVMDKDFLDRIPLGRTFTSALLIVPGSVASNFAGIGTGFAGSQGIENVFLIDGMNTSNTGFGGQSSTFPPEFLETLEVKIGGYMPEFRSSTGGIVNTILKSGGNEFHGDVWFNYSSQWLSTTPETSFSGAIGRRDFNKLTTDFGFAVGGPIIKDKLWFFAGFSPSFSLADVNRFVFRQFEDTANLGSYRLDANGDPVREQVNRSIYERNFRRLSFAAKLTFAPSATQRVALSYFGDPNQITGATAQGGGTSVGILVNEPSSFLGTSEAGAQTAVLNYTGKFFDKRVQVEATAGYYREVGNAIPVQTNTALITLTTPIWQLPEPVCQQDPSMTIPTCPTGSGYTLGGGFLQYQTFQRGYLSAKVSFFVPRHQIKVGADIEWNTYTQQQSYSGGTRDQFRYATRRDLNGDGTGDREVEHRVDERGFVLFDINGNPVRQRSIVLQTSYSRNFGIFAQDSWSILDNLTFNFGLRWSQQKLYGAEGDSVLEDPLDPTSRVLNTVLSLNKNFAPRAGIIWDPFKDGRTKIYGNFGVFYMDIPLDLGVRALASNDVFAVYLRDISNHNMFGGQYQNAADPGFFIPLGGSPTGIQDNLSPQYIYEWIAGIEHELIPSYRIGFNFVKRTLGNLIEDLSVDDGNHYFIGNPGTGPTGAQEIARLMANPGSQPDSRCFFRDPSVPESLGCTGDFPKGVRDYDSYTLFFEKRLTEDQPWQFKFSWTVSFLNGNIGGGFAPNNGQLDPNLTSQFDLVSLLANRLGFLDFDHRHTIKFFGSFNFKKLGVPGLTLGIGIDTRSGRPVNHLGAHDLYGTSEAFALKRGSGGRLPWLTNANLFFEYKFAITKGVSLAFNAVIFNFLNLKETVAVDQNYTFDPICPIPGGTVADLPNLRIAEGSDPVTGACIPSSESPTPNPNYRQPLLFQAPVAARLGLKLSF